MIMNNKYSEGVAKSAFKDNSTKDITKDISIADISTKDMSAKKINTKGISTREIANDIITVDINTKSISKDINTKDINTKNIGIKDITRDITNNINTKGIKDIMTSNINAGNITKDTTDDKSFISTNETKINKKIMKFDEYFAYENTNYLLNKKYKFISPIQEGSFGKVTLALNVENNTKVAMKAMYKSNSKNIAKHEIDILSKLGNKNDNICQLFDSFETTDFIILILEYCANGDLYELIHSSNIPAGDIWKIAKELSNGLNYAHINGVYHRDIKPENVLFNDAGQVRLCDWGLATTKRYNDEFNVGTEKYMAPECFIKKIGFKKYDAKLADYWSFGITLLTAVFGTSPFKPMGKSKSLESDYNFKNFVNFNNPQILYDIYPTMNENCFEVFMGLLKIGGIESDLKNFNQIIMERDLNKFIKEFENCWRLGLTIDEEFDNEEFHTKDAMFEMDQDDSEISKNSQQTLYESELESDNFDEDLSNYNLNKHIPINSLDTIYKFATNNSMIVPSLIESSVQSTSKSWCDLDDDEEFEKWIYQLSLSSNQPKIKLKDKVMSKIAQADYVKIIGHEMLNDSTNVVN